MRCLGTLHTSCCQERCFGKLLLVPSLCSFHLGLSEPFPGGQSCLPGGTPAGELARGFALIEPAVTKQFGISGWKGTYKLKTFLLNSKMGNLTTKLPANSLLVAERLCVHLGGVPGGCSAERCANAPPASGLLLELELMIRFKQNAGKAHNFVFLEMICRGAFQETRGNELTVVAPSLPGGGSPG